MSRLLDRLRGAQRARNQKNLLFDALKKAHAEREAARQASEAIAQASELVSIEAGAPGDCPSAGARTASPAGPLRREARTAAIIALLVAAGALCAAVAWRGTADIEQRTGLKIDSGLDLKRIAPERATAPEAKRKE